MGKKCFFLGFHTRWVSRDSVRVRSRKHQRHIKDVSHGHAHPSASHLQIVLVLVSNHLQIVGFSEIIYTVMLIKYTTQLFTMEHTFIKQNISIQLILLVGEQIIAKLSARNKQNKNYVFKRDYLKVLCSCKYFRKHLYHPK